MFPEFDSHIPVLSSYIASGGVWEIKLSNCSHALSQSLLVYYFLIALALATQKIIFNDTIMK